jgi:hypothetical protein
VSHSEEKRAQLAAVVDAILATGTPMASIIEMFTEVLRANGLTTEPNPIASAAASIKLDTAADAEQIAAWFEAQAAKERELLDSWSTRLDARERIQERWLVYKASAMEVRAGTWRKP